MVEECIALVALVTGPGHPFLSLTGNQQTY